MWRAEGLGRGLMVQGIRFRIRSGGWGRRVEREEDGGCRVWDKHFGNDRYGEVFGVKGLG